jgi:hypothetical protein
MLLSSPPDFAAALGDLPHRVIVKSRMGAESDVIVLFVAQFSKLKADFGRAATCLPASGGMLWVAWPKRASNVITDLSENLIRDFGLAAGLVDTKVCAIDEVWSGLRFSRRRTR